MPPKPAATQENNAWRSRKRVVADYVPECMRHHIKSSRSPTGLGGLGLLGWRRKQKALAI